MLLSSLIWRRRLTDIAAYVKAITDLNFRTPAPTALLNQCDQHCERYMEGAAPQQIWGLRRGREADLEREIYGGRGTPKNMGAPEGL